MPILQRLGLLSSRCNFHKLLDRRCPSKVRHGLYRDSHKEGLCYADDACRNLIRSSNVASSAKRSAARSLYDDEFYSALHLLELNGVFSPRQDLSIDQPRTQVSRGEVSLDTSHPSLVIPHGQTQAVAQNVKKPKLSEYACTIYEVECYVLDCVRDVIPKAFWGSEANRKVVEKSEPCLS